MRVSLLNLDKNLEGEIYYAALGGLTCTANTDKLCDPNFEPVDFLKRIIKKGHESVIEHITLHFEIKGISRALLQELARHRHISLSVESTRWSLGKTLLNLDDVKREAARGEFFEAYNYKAFELGCDHYLVSASARVIRELMEFLKVSANCGIKPDLVKYFLPELFPTNLVMTCNLRELRHIYRLRSKPPALKEFNNLCAKIKDALPEDIQELLVLE